MASERKFYRTKIVVEVLSEELYRNEDINVIAYDITHGDCSGIVNCVESKEIDGKTAATLLIEQGSDPEFFQLDDEGNDKETN